MAVSIVVDFLDFLTASTDGSHPPRIEGSQGPQVPTSEDLNELQLLLEPHFTNRAPFLKDFALKSILASVTIRFGQVSEAKRQVGALKEQIQTEGWNGLIRNGMSDPSKMILAFRNLFVALRENGELTEARSLLAMLLSEVPRYLPRGISGWFPDIDTTTNGGKLMRDWQDLIHRDGLTTILPGWEAGEKQAPLQRWVDLIDGFSDLYEIIITGEELWTQRKLKRKVPEDKKEELKLAAHCIKLALTAHYQYPSTAMMFDEESFNCEFRNESDEESLCTKEGALNNVRNWRTKATMLFKKLADAEYSLKNGDAALRSYWKAAGMGLNPKGPTSKQHPETIDYSLSYPARRKMLFHMFELLSQRTPIWPTEDRFDDSLELNINDAVDDDADINDNEDGWLFLTGYSQGKIWESFRPTDEFRHEDNHISGKPHVVAIAALGYQLRVWHGRADTKKIRNIMHTAYKAFNDAAKGTRAEEVLDLVGSYLVERGSVIGGVSGQIFIDRAAMITNNRAKPIERNNEDAELKFQTPLVSDSEHPEVDL